MSTGAGRPVVRLHDVSVSGPDGLDAPDADSLVAAVRDAVSGAVADGTPTPEGVRAAVASSVAARAASSVDGSRS